MTVDVLLPFIGPLASTGVGAITTVAVLKQWMKTTDRDVISLSTRVSSLEKDRDLFIDRLARIETKLDLLIERRKQPRD